MGDPEAGGGVLEVVGPGGGCGGLLGRWFCTCLGVLTFRGAWRLEWGWKREWENGREGEEGRGGGELRFQTGFLIPLSLAVRGAVPISRVAIGASNVPTRRGLYVKD